MRAAATRRAIAIAGCVLLIGACSNGGPSPTVEATVAPATNGAPPSTAPSTNPSSTNPSSTTAPAAPLDAKTVLASTRGSIVYITTPIASGSGILLADGYVVTNAHVVDPFGVASITFAGGDTFDDTKVIGVDVFADIALLGPIDARATPLTFEDPAGLVGGDELYLVGYPGEVDPKPEPTISRGILSRLRSVPEFDQHYVQTDAAIAHGQSGGALLDKAGHVIGISGLSFADDKFALAIAAPDVERAIAAIRSGKGTDYHALPSKATETKSTLALASSAEFRPMYFPAAPAARKVHLTIPDSAAWEIDTIAGDLVTIDKAQVTKLAGDTTPADFLPAGATVATATSPGEWDVTLPPDIGAILAVGTTTDAGATFDVTSSEPFASLPDTDQDRQITIGSKTTGILDTYENDDSYVVTLAVGDKLSITASSPQGDVDYAVLAPGEKRSDAVFVTDGGGGLYNLDAKGTFTATVAGPHRIIVVSNDDVATGYRLTVERA